jgi:hypothetical protein
MRDDPMRREPTIEDLLSDPIAIMLMQRDGVDRGWLDRFLADMRHRLTAGPDIADEIGRAA